MIQLPRDQHADQPRHGHKAPWGNRHMALIPSGDYLDEQYGKVN